MDFNQALKILGINSGFTEEKLKKSYRDLMKMLHPDANVGKSEEELKEIEERAKAVNAAYEYLYNGNFEQRNLDEYIELLYNELLRYNKIDYFYPDTSCEISLYRDKVMNAIMYFSFQNKLKTLSKAEIDQLFQKTKKKIRLIYDDLKGKYFNQYGIDKKYEKGLNYEVSIQDFYEQLKEIKEQAFIPKLNKEILKYQNYKGYDYLKEWIEKDVLDNCQERVKDMGLDQAIKVMHQEIEELFALYFEILKNFSAVKKILEDNTNYLSQEYLDNMKLEYTEVLASFESKSSLNDVEKKLDEMKERMEKQIKLESQSKMYDPIFKKIIAKYYESIQKYQFINSTDKIYSLTKILEMVIQIFNLVKMGKIEFDSLSVLDGLTFDGELLDANIISSVYHNLTVVNESNIYIKKDINMPSSIWYVLVQKEGALFLRSYGKFFGVSECTITEKELVEKYMPLDQFIKDIKPVGEKREFFGITTKILYSNGMYTVGLNDADKLDIGCESDSLKFAGYFELPIEYQDKEYVKMRLIEMIYDELNQRMNKSR